MEIEDFKRTKDTIDILNSLAVKLSNLNEKLTSELYNEIRVKIQKNVEKTIDEVKNSYIEKMKKVIEEFTKNITLEPQNIDQIKKYLQNIDKNFSAILNLLNDIFREQNKFVLKDEIKRYIKSEDFDEAVNRIFKDIEFLKENLASIKDKIEETNKRFNKLEVENQKVIRKTIEEKTNEIENEIKEKFKDNINLEIENKINNYFVNDIKPKILEINNSVENTIITVQNEVENLKASVNDTTKQIKDMKSVIDNIPSNLKNIIDEKLSRIKEVLNNEIAKMVRDRVKSEISEYSDNGYEVFNSDFEEFKKSIPTVNRNISLLKEIVELLTRRIEKVENQNVIVKDTDRTENYQNINSKIRTVEQAINDFKRELTLVNNNVATILSNQQKLKEKDLDSIWKELGNIRKELEPLKDIDEIQEKLNQYSNEIQEIQELKDDFDNFKEWVRKEIKHKPVDIDILRKEITDELKAEFNNKIDYLDERINKLKEGG